MPFWAEIALAIVLGPFLWLAGAVFFDFVHWVLHAMLRSPLGLLRALAWPHSVHHQWIDRELEVRWENQRRNIWCHIVPEYWTQLVFTTGVALVLPLPFAVVLAGLQTLVFGLILRERGLDLNHRPIELLDAYRPGFMTPPAYHALHHVHPDAYFSAYTKLVDFLVGGAAQLGGRRFVLLDAAEPFVRALGDALHGRGVRDISLVDSLEQANLCSTDVLVLCNSDANEAAILEAFIDATQVRKLPPEAWVVHTRPDDATARYYVDDVRIHYRTLVVPELEQLSTQHAAAAARRAVARIRRGFHFVPTTAWLRDLDGRQRFRATRPAQPAEARPLRYRRDLQ